MQDHIVLSFAPDKTHPRHSEGSFIRLNDGKILFIYSRFNQGDHDDSPSDLVAITSADEGETWSEPVVTLPASRHGTSNVMSVSLERMANGDIGLFYGVKRTLDVRPAETTSAGSGQGKTWFMLDPLVTHICVYLARSSDEGKTWYKTTECTLPDRNGYYVFNNDRVERLPSGRIILPLSCHRNASTPEGLHYFDGRAFGCFVYSDDDGETWNEAPGSVYPPFTGTDSGLQEAGVIRHNNGVLQSYFRTDKMFHYEAFSLDDGMHWTEAQPSRFTGPCSPLKIKRNPYTGDLYAIWNPIPNYNGRYTSKAGWGRTPFVWAVSHDDGLTWSDYKIIEDHPEHGYCYPGVFFTNDGAMLVAYCAGGPDDGACLNRLSMMKIAI